MGGGTINNTLGRGVDMVSCCVVGADESNESLCFYYMFSELGVLISIWLRDLSQLYHRFIGLEVLDFVMDSCGTGSDGKYIG